MAYFCTKSGVRIVAPGVARSAGGDVEEFTDGEPAPVAVAVGEPPAAPVEAPADATTRPKRGPKTNAG